MKNFAQTIWRNKRLAGIGLLLLICLYTQNSCSASRLGSDSSPDQIELQQQESRQQGDPRSTAEYQESPLSQSHGRADGTDSALYLPLLNTGPINAVPINTGPIDTVPRNETQSTLQSPLLEPDVNTAETATGGITIDGISAESAMSDEEALDDAVTQLKALLGEQIVPLKVLEQEQQETTASQLSTEPERDFFLSETGSLTTTQSITGTLTITASATIFLPFVSSQQPVLQPPEAEPTPVPIPLPTPDSMFRVAKVPILMYHYLSIPPANADIYRRDLSVAPDLFARQLDSMLEAGYQTISLYELTMHLTIGAPLPARPVVITFDDGYRDNYENAFPLLTERGMTATFFVSPEFIDRQRPEYADWTMLRTMFVGGMSIEAHGLNHRSLKGRNVDFLAWQSLASIQAIERETGKRPRFVSYPAGEYDELTIEVFKNSHFWAGLTTIQGTTQQSDDLFTMRRVRVRNTTQPNELIRLMELDW